MTSKGVVAAAKGRLEACKTSASTDFGRWVAETMIWFGIGMGGAHVDECYVPPPLSPSEPPKEMLCTRGTAAGLPFVPALLAANVVGATSMEAMDITFETRAGGSAELRVAMDQHLAFEPKPFPAQNVDHITDAVKARLRAVTHDDDECAGPDVKVVFDAELPRVRVVVSPCPPVIRDGFVKKHAAVAAKTTDALVGQWILDVVEFLGRQSHSPDITTTTCEAWAHGTSLACPRFPACLPFRPASTSLQLSVCPGGELALMLRSENKVPALPFDGVVAYIVAKDESLAFVRATHTPQCMVILFGLKD